MGLVVVMGFWGCLVFRVWSYWVEVSVEFLGEGRYFMVFV